LEIKTEKKKNKEKEHYLRFGPNLSSAHFGLPFRVAQHPSRSLTCGPRGQTLSLAACQPLTRWGPLVSSVVHLGTAALGLFAAATECRLPCQGSRSSCLARTSLLEYKSGVAVSSFSPTQCTQSRHCRPRRSLPPPVILIVAGV
jgi:hypothetical protein